jgi:hypothetical protein
LPTSGRYISAGRSCARLNVRTAAFRRVLHVLILWSFGVAQPLYEVFRRNGEFFVAHRTEPVDLAILLVILTILAPALVAAAAEVVHRVSPRWGQAVHLTIVGALVAANVSQAFVHAMSLPAVPHFALTGAVTILAIWLYASNPSVRTFVTYLSPGIVAFPVWLLLQPSMAPFVWSHRSAESGAAIRPRSTPPVVVVVFDQLPVASLLTWSGEVDPRFPAFAALASEATWFRNATTVAELTGWAMPGIVTGSMPRPGKLPNAADYPFNLFTMLGDTYRREVVEPITQFCPRDLCDPDSDPLSQRITTTLADSAIIYAHTVLPWDLRSSLPPLTQDWKNFLRGEHWHTRWVTARDRDRSEGPRAFIDGISRSDPQPTLYFLHALLPHEPYVYLSTGQRFTEDRPTEGITRTGGWVNDEWPVIQVYRQHLVQLQFVDSLLGQLVAKLRAEGLYDRTLLVVTGDHGVSFRPGHSMKGPAHDTLADIMAVPLFVKLPGQRKGVVDDSNVQTIDIVPTIADVLEAPLPWPHDGRSALVAGSRPSVKTLRHRGARDQIDVEAGDLARMRMAAAERKMRLFGPVDNVDFVPTISTHHELIGQPLNALPLDDQGELRVLLNEPWQYVKRDPRAELVRGIVSGQVVDGRGSQVPATVAIAVNGVVRATTQTLPFAGRRGHWTAFIHPRHFHAGANEIEAFIVRDISTTVRLERAYASSGRPDSLNLASRGAHDYWAVQQKGFYEREGQPIPYQWTEGRATLVVPMKTTALPRSLRVGLARARSGTPLTISFNACVLFKGIVSDTPWFSTFSLSQCPGSPVRAPEAKIVIESATAPDAEGRTVGVGVETVNLYTGDWPIARPQTGTWKATVVPVKPFAAPIVAGTPVDVVVQNDGTAVWLRSTDAAAGADAVDLALRWKADRASTPVQEQRLTLPRAWYPTDRAVVTIPVVVPPALRGAGPWQLSIVPIRADGTPLAANPLTARVAPEHSSD